jgi:hypothetical protein
MIALSLIEIEFGATPAYSVGRALQSRRNRVAPVLTRWKGGMGRLDLVYPLVQKNATQFSVDFTLATVADSDHVVWVRTTLATGSSRLLGVVQSTRIRVPAGSKQITVTALLEATALAEAGVSRSTFEWQWEYSTAKDGTYVLFSTSPHRLYVVIREPVFPWTGNTQAPGEVIWTEVLDWSCRWAATARTAPAAAAAISSRIHQLGHLGFTAYQKAEAFHWAGGSAHVFGAFLCTNFLTLLAGETDLAHARGNCTDVAAIVVTFANSLGCGLARFRISRPASTLRLNPVRLIGHDLNGTNKVLPEEGFLYHDAAGHGNSGTPDLIYDACVAFDCGVRGRPTRSWISPAGLPRTGPGSYEERLLPRSERKGVSWSRCKDLWIDTPPLATVPALDPIARQRYESYQSLLTGGERLLVADSGNLDDYVLSQSPIASRSIPTWFNGVVTEEIWTAEPRSHPEETVYVSIIVCADSATARGVGAEMLARCQPSFALAGTHGGPAVLVDALGSLAAFIAGTRVVIVDGDNASISAFAQALALQMVMVQE